MKIGDAFGQALLERHRGGTEPSVVERSDGFVAAERMDYFAPVRRWGSHEREGLRHMGGRVLDVGCGGGRLALALQDRGMDVLGIDISPCAVKVCRERGVLRVKRLPVSKVSRALGRFDTIAMYGNNFGLVENPRRAVWLLRRFAAFTGPDGRIVATTLDPYGTTDPTHLGYHRANRRAGRMGGQIRLRIRHRDLATPWFDYLFVSLPELRRLAKAGGWEVSTVIPTEGSEYTAVLAKRAAA